MVDGKPPQVEFPDARTIRYVWDPAEPDCSCRRWPPPGTR